MSEAQEKKAAPVINTVTMEDGRVIDFVGKRKILKSSSLVDGKLITVIDFANGKSVNFVAPQEILAQLAGHGAEQKLGDAAAGAEDLDDAFEAVQELATRLGRGEWNVKRESSGASGASILVKALCKLYPARTVEQIREFLSNKTHAEKMALRNSEKVRPIVEELEAARAKKPGNVIDTDALMQGLEG